MAIEGVDYSWARPDVNCMYDKGRRFACRYLSYDYTGKNLTAAEATELQAGGFAIVSNWENDAGDAKLGYNAGIEYAQEANRQHLNCGGPVEAPIYFSVDWDAQMSDLAGPIAEYYKGIASVLGLNRVGAYGGYEVIDYLFDHKLITYGWQTYAWSEGRWDSRAQLRQYLNSQTLCGGSVDFDQAMTADYGQWGGQATKRTYGGSMFLFTVEGDSNVWASEAGKRRAFSGPDTGGVYTYRAYTPLTDAGVPMAKYTSADIGAMGLSVEEALDWIGGPVAGSSGETGHQPEQHGHKRRGHHGQDPDDEVERT